tara:strand:+ start:884 stop:1084 length:201 start_codon:yes stop_codon:yes gene_type:complete
LYKTNIFTDEKELKKWAIKLANQLGGQIVEKTPVLDSIKMDKVKKLIDQFVNDHNANMINVLREEE